MAASALVNDYIIIEGEDYPKVQVNFGRDPSLNIALLGGAKWDQATAVPMEDIEAAALAVRQISKGAVVTELVMDGKAWGLLRKHSSMKDMIDTNFRRSLGTASAIDAAPRTTMNDGVYVGTLNGRIDLWVYDAYYQDDNGTDQPYLADYTVLGLSGALEGTQYYGAIIDLDAQLEPRRSFTKSKVNFNPSGIEIVTQSAPLAAPKRPNAMFKLTVK